MAGEWEAVELGEVAAVRSGYAFKSSDWKDAGIPVVKIANVKGGRLEMSGCSFVAESTAAESGEFRLTTGDILIAMTGYIGDVARVRKTDLPCVLNQRVGKFSVRDKKRLDADFLYTFLAWAETRQTIEALGYGSAQPNVSPSLIHKVELPLPPLAEQKAIAAVLGALDDKIELNRRMNATLEAMARALFQSWFVDFDPVRAKLDGRPPAALDPATAALFPEHLEETALGHTPKGWEVCPLSEKIQLLSGGTPKTSEPTYWDGDIPWYSVRDAPSETDVWVIRTDKHVTKLGIANSAAQIFPEKTTIISARGTVGTLALTAVPMAMNQSCYGVRGVTGYGDYFTYYSLREATAQLQQRTHGTVFDTITTETFKTLDCIFPTPKITAAFDKLVEPLLGQIRANLHQSRTLATLRDTLLPKLLSGELSVAPTDKESLSVQNTSKKS